MVKILWPWKNLGCLGFKGGKWYLDFFLKPYPGMFFTNGKEAYRAGFWWIRKHGG